MAGIVANDPLFLHKVGKALATSTINNGAVDGVAVPLDGLGAQYVTFVVICDSIAASAALAITVQGQRRDTAAWEALKVYGTATDLTFTASKMLDAATLEVSGFLAGSVDLSYVNQKTYKAIRIRAVESGSQAVDIAAAWFASDLQASADPSTDDLIEKMRPQSGATVAV